MTMNEVETEKLESKRVIQSPQYLKTFGNPILSCDISTSKPSFNISLKEKATIYLNLTLCLLNQGISFILIKKAESPRILITYVSNQYKSKALLV